MHVSCTVVCLPYHFSQTTHACILYCHLPTIPLQSDYTCMYPVLSSAYHTTSVRLHMHVSCTVVCLPYHFSQTTHACILYCRLPTIPLQSDYTCMYPVLSSAYHTTSVRLHMHVSCTVVCLPYHFSQTTHACILYCHLSSIPPQSDHTCLYSVLSSAYHTTSVGLHMHASCTVICLPYHFSQTTHACILYCRLPIIPLQSDYTCMYPVLSSAYHTTSVRLHMHASCTVVCLPYHFSQTTHACILYCRLPTIPLQSDYTCLYPVLSSAYHTTSVGLHMHVACTVLCLPYRFSLTTHACILYCRLPTIPLQLDYTCMYPVLSSAYHTTSVGLHMHASCTVICLPYHFSQTTHACILYCRLPIIPLQSDYTCMYPVLSSAYHTTSVRLHMHASCTVVCLPYHFSQTTHACILYCRLPTIPLQSDYTCLYPVLSSAYHTTSVGLHMHVACTVLCLPYRFSLTTHACILYCRLPTIPLQLDYTCMYPVLSSAYHTTSV